MSLTGGCSGAQSALAPAGAQAARIADLFWMMTAGSVAILAIFLALTAYATYSEGEPHPKLAQLMIVGGGIVVPTVLLTLLLVAGLWMLPSFLTVPPQGTLKVSITGEQWWWRVRYHLADGDKVELANELHLPVDEPVSLLLNSKDVIHSLWIPSLGGKVDMIPGRQTRLTLTPTRVGTFRGVCAEYCGTSHALMAFAVSVSTPSTFSRWLSQQAQPARARGTPGEQLFTTHGCGSCHAVRGTAADGVVGPDLTHVGSRQTVAAGTLPQGHSGLRQVIAHPAAVKPGVNMPAFHMLGEDSLDALAAYMQELK